MVGSRVSLRMIMRAEVHRNSTTTKDPYNQPEAPVFSLLATIPCWAWTDNRNEENDDRKHALIEDLICGIQLDADVTENDRIQQIKDRQGTVIWDGPLRIDTIQIRRQHKELRLKRIQP